jgi:hypothetical protein
VRDSESQGVREYTDTHTHGDGYGFALALAALFAEGRSHRSLQYLATIESLLGDNPPEHSSLGRHISMPLPCRL